ncbi:unnamed protein product [Phaedon cochleariae]|uniref:Protein artemis n=1 Tax=Phaedon cochleariae TaxID=80249 RepID=A0A9P0GS67_PHACE|nr:unnamed protein product [Phaedon cochleariae]
MSTFGGKIQEYPEISVDRFDKENVHSTAYFLSHCHTDHMVGLSNFHFQEQMVEKFKYLYASQITCVIISKMYPYIKRNLKELSLYSPTTIHLKKCAFSVTPIPAGHCPGSVMFLFEGEKCVLYTGDYRINKNDIPKFKPFYDTFGRKKAIHKMYLDTTFFSRKYPYFPRRDESLRELCKIIKEWTQSGKQFIIKLNTSAKYGYEYLFNEIWKQTNMSIHVSEDVYNFYMLVPEMDKSVTLDGSTTQIHCKCNYPDICDFKLDSFVKPIKISAFRWTEEQLKEGLSNCETETHYVCYSTHASYEEGVHLIRFIRPKEIEACVKHDDPNFNKEMLKLIDDLLEEINENQVDERLTPKLFDVEAVGGKKPKRKNTYDKSCDYLNIMDSPPRQMNFDENLQGFDSACQLESKNFSKGINSTNYKTEDISIVSEILSPVRNIEITSNTDGNEFSIEKSDEHSVLLDFLESPCRSQNLENLEADKPDFLIEDTDESCENSILMNIIDSGSSDLGISERNENISEEASIIFSIIGDYPPNKRKK